MTNREGHPYANRYPMLSEDELNELAESIADTGLINEIVLTVDGQVLDGRNRLAACKIAGVEPRFTTYEGDDPAGYVMAANVRRNQPTGARAMSTALVLSDAGRRIDGRWKRGSLPIDKSDSRHNAWRLAMASAGVVLDHAPALADAVIAGNQSLDAAYKHAKKIQKDNETAVARLGRLKESHLDLARKVADDDLVLEEAEAIARQRAAEYEKILKQTTQILEMCCLSVSHLQSVAAGTFAHFDEAFERLNTIEQENLTEAIETITKGTRND